MSAKSEDFERLIQRIHELVEDSDAEVTWDDRIPDPDNPDQPRQIDVTIIRNGRLTLVECRIHKARQDVKWIEELIGRRTSLKAEAIIAVSNSGFTRGAIKKAKAHGIILRDILSLTPDEIREWGTSTEVELRFYEYTRIGLEFFFDSGSKPPLDHANLERWIRENPHKVYGMFEQVTKQFSDKPPNDLVAKVKCDLHSDDVVIAGQPLQRIHFEAHVAEKLLRLETPAVVVYDEPAVDALERSVFVESFDLGESKIFQSRNHVMVALDLSSIRPQPNWQFNSIWFDYGREVTCVGYEILSPPRFEMSLDNIRIRCS